MGLTVGQRLWLGWAAIAAVLGATYVHVLQTGHGGTEGLTGAAAATEARRAAIAAMQEGLNGIAQSTQAVASGGERQGPGNLAEAQERFKQALARYRATASNPNAAALADEVGKRSDALNAQMNELQRASDMRREKHAAFERYLAEGRVLADGPPVSPTTGSVGRAARRQAAAREVARQVQGRLREATAHSGEAALRNAASRSQLLAALARYEVFADSRAQRDWLAHVRRWIGEADRHSAAVATADQAQQRALADARAQQQALQTFLGGQIEAVAGVDLRSAMDRYVREVAQRQNRLEQVLLAAAIAVAAIGLITMIAARRPLRRLTAWTRPYVASDLSYQTLSMRNDEVAELRAAVQALIDRLESMQKALHAGEARATQAEGEAPVSAAAAAGSETPPAPVAAPEAPTSGLLAEQIAHALARARRQDSSVALLHVEIDPFKGVDEVLGTQDSAQLMQAATDRLYAGLRLHDIVMRTGADRFAVLLQDVREAEQVRRVAEKILSELSLPVEMGNGLELPLRAHIGIALAPDDADAAQPLVAAAANAALQARDARGAGYAFSTPQLNDEMLRRHAIEHALRQPDLFSQMVLEYAPRVYVDGNRLVAAQAAACWRHPEFGMLNVDRFLPLAPGDTATAIDDWSVHEACRQLAAWRQAGFAPVPIAVRMGRSHGNIDHLLEQVESALGQSGVEARWLELEWDVRLLPPDDDVGRALERLQQMGLGLALDVDAADRAALGRARRLPITRVKLGQALMQSIRSNPLDQAMARATITLARSLGAEIVVEGVESLAQAEFLRAEGCLILQGPLHGLAMAASEFEARLSKAARTPAAAVQDAP